MPFISNEANVFITFERKAATILDHLDTTAKEFSGRSVVVCNSATKLDYIPDNSIDFIFTDPPFGANINYSEMNIVWESWLGEFTDPKNEAIVNRHQGKDVSDYQRLMTISLQECYRVLRPGHWLLVVFMNSSGQVWSALKEAVRKAGFETKRIDIFDKQHGTFKQFVSENAAGSDLVLHCIKPKKKHGARRKTNVTVDLETSVAKFVTSRKGDVPKIVYLHVDRATDIDYRMLYSEWIAFGMLNDHPPADFSTFRNLVCAALSKVQPD